MNLSVQALDALNPMQVSRPAIVTQYVCHGNGYTPCPPELLLFACLPPVLMRPLPAPDGLPRGAFVATPRGVTTVTALVRFTVNFCLGGIFVVLEARGGFVGWVIASIRYGRKKEM